MVARDVLTLKMTKIVLENPSHIFDRLLKDPFYSNTKDKYILYISLRPNQVA